MFRSITVLAAVAVVFVLVSGIAMAAPSFLGTSGLILTPDDSVLGVSDFSAGYHDLDWATVIGVNVGVAQNLELGIARLDSDGADEDTMLNAKYRLLAETATAPSVVIGVVDSDFYGVVGKNLTPMATGITGEPVMPLRGFVGIGSGDYDGVFAGVDWAITQKAKIIAEYIAEDSVFNVGARLAITDSLTFDAAMIDGDDFAFGISYTKLGL